MKYFSLTGSSHHQGIVARVGPFPYVELDDFLSGNEAIHGPLLILDQVQDPANFGNIIRSAECLGAPAVIVAKDRSVGITAAVEKAAAGASAHIPIIRVVNLVRVIDELKSCEFLDLWDTPAGSTLAILICVLRQDCVCSRLGREGHASFGKGKM